MIVPVIIGIQKVVNQKIRKVKIKFVKKLVETLGQK